MMGENRPKPKRPHRRSSRQDSYCGAKKARASPWKRSGPCRAYKLKGRPRCKWHSGLAFGATTDEGRERIAQAQRRAWEKLRAEYGVPPGFKSPRNVSTGRRKREGLTWAGWVERHGRWQGEQSEEKP